MRMIVLALALTCTLVGCSTEAPPVELPIARLASEFAVEGRYVIGDDGPTPALHRVHGVPKEVLRAARTSPEGRQLRKDSVAKLRRLCRELGLMTPTATRVWKGVGLWDHDAAGPAPADA